MVVHQEEEFFEVDDMKNRINDEHELDVKEIFMSAIQIRHHQMKKICHAAYLMVECIVIVICEQKQVNIKMNVV